MGDDSFSIQGRGRSFMQGRTPTRGTPGASRPITPISPNRSISPDRGSNTSGRRSPLPGSRMSTMLARDSANAAEVDDGISRSLVDARENRARIEMMREQLREFERVTQDNAKEIKALRAERFQLIQNDAEAQSFPAVSFATQVEDSQRAKFAQKSHPVPHVDIKDVDEPHLVTPTFVGTSLGPASNKMEKDAAVASDEDSDVDSVLHMHSKWEEDALEDDHDDGMEQVETLKSWVASVFAPEGRHPKPDAGPKWRLLLDRVHGFSGSDKTNIIISLASNEIVYPAGCIAVVASGMAQSGAVTQRFFTDHDNEIAAICLHPDGQTVATADVGVGSRVCIWDSDLSSMELLAKPMEMGGESLHPRGVRCMCFTKDGRHLVTVGADHDHMIAVTDWKSGQVICSEKGDKNTIVSIRCNPHDGCFVTVGKHHIKFWTVKVTIAQEPLPAQAAMTVWQRVLESKRGVFGRHATDKSRTLLCVDFVGPGMSISGGSDGSLLLWKGVMVTSAIVAHDGPIFSMGALDGEGVTRVATGGKDGRVRIWVIDARAVLRPAVLTVNVSQSCIKSVCWDEPTENIFVGTIDNSIYCVRAEEGFNARLAMSAHRRGAVHAVASHPSRPVYASGGEDGLVCLWHSITGKMLSFVVVDGGGVKSLAYASNGELLAAGLLSGGVQVLVHDGQADRLSKAARYGQVMKSAVGVVSFSPDCEFLAIGTDKHKIEILKSPSLRTKVGTFTGHAGAITHLDWSRDGKTIVSNSEACDLLFWGSSNEKAGSSKEGYKARLPGACKDMDWFTWTCNLGWPVKGLTPAPGKDEMSITSVARSDDRTVLASGDTGGFVRVSAYPCTSQACLRDSLSLHCGGVSSVSFLAPTSSGEEKDQEEAMKAYVLVSSGRRDGCILQYSVVEAAHGWSRGEEHQVKPVTDELQLPPELVRIIHHTKALSSAADAGKQSGDPEADLLDAAGPFLSNVCPPSTFEENLEPPNWMLVPRRIQGCEGHRMRACARMLLNGSVVYASGHLVVIQGKQVGVRPQRIMSLHTARVQSLCVHPDGETVASAQEGRPGTVLVWSSDSLQLLASLTNESNGICSMAFGLSGSMLFVTSNSRGQPLSAWAWDKNHLKARGEMEAEEGKFVLTLAASPHEEDSEEGQVVIAAGSGVVRFWRHQGERLRCRGGISVRDIGVHTCIAFGEPEVAFTGTSKGEVWVWHHHQHIQTLPLLQDSIYDISSNFSLHQLAVGGQDGSVQIVTWELEVVSSLPLEDFVSHLVSCSSRSGGVITCLEWSATFECLLVATADCELFEIQYPHGEGGAEALIHAHSHSGTVTSLSCHALEGVAMSAGSEGTVRLWATSEEGTPLALVHLEADRFATALDMNGAHGLHVAVGMSDGSIQVWHRSSLEGIVLADLGGLLVPKGQPYSKRRRAIICIRFSPCGRYIAAGTQDGLIDIYDAKMGGEALGTCKGHFGSLTDIDWDSEGEHITSNSSSSELFFWNTSTFETNRNPLALRDSSWATGTCRLTWATMAAIPPGDEGALMSVCRSNPITEEWKRGTQYFAAGYEGGDVKLFRFPAPSQDCASVPYKSGMSCVSHLAFSCDDSFLWAAGGEDGGLVLFSSTFVKPFPSRTPDIDLILAKPLSSSSRGTSVLSVSAEPSSPQRDDMGIGAVKQYLQNVFPPTSVAPLPPPGMLGREMVLEHVYGYRGCDTRSSVGSLASGQVAYTAMGMVVLADLEGDARKGDKMQKADQRYFREHLGDVTCMAVNPDGVRVATGETGDACTILIWNSDTLVVENRLAGFKDGKKWVADSVGISSVAFGGKGGKLLVALGMAEGMVASLYDWDQSRLLSYVATGAEGLLGTAVHPVAQRFMTCGVKHLAFWEMGKTKLQGERGQYGDLATERTMVCGAYVSQKGSDKNLALTGAIDGSIFVWTEGQLVQTVPCHTGAIIDMWLGVGDSLLATGGEDGIVWLWSFDKNDLRLIKRSNVISEGAKCVRSVCGSYKGGGGMFVGTSDGLISHVGVAEASQTLEGSLTIVVQGHAAGDVTALVCHPAEYNVFITAGKDGTIRMWDARVRGPATSSFIQLPLADDLDYCTCMDLVPANGDILACGMASGAVILLRVSPSECTTPTQAQPQVQISKPGFLSFAQSEQGDTGIRTTTKSKKVVCLRFGLSQEEDVQSDSVLLAVSSQDSVIDIYKLLEKRAEGGQGDGFLKHIGSCRGHNSELEEMQLEWDFTGRILVSACGGEELLFWDMKYEERGGSRRPRCKEMRAVEARDAQWSGWSLALGWPVKGIALDAGRNWQMTCLHAARNSPLCAVGRSDGAVSLYSFPCLSPSEPITIQRAHTFQVTCARVLYTDEHVISVGKTDACVAQWTLKRSKGSKKEQGAEESVKDSCIEAALKYLREKKSVAYSHHSKETITKEGGEDEVFVSSFHPYLASIREPEDRLPPTADDLSAPDDELKLEFIMGYNADLLGNMQALRSGEVVYAVAKVCVVLNLAGGRRTQRFFTRHDKDVTTVAVHPEGVICASGEVGEYPTCFVWNSRTMQPLANLKGYHRATLSSICFNQMDGSMLALVGCGDRGSNIAFFEWSSGSLMAESDTVPLSIVNVRSNSITGSYVTSGEDHACFWRLSGRNLTQQGCALPNPGDVFCAIEFLGMTERNAMAATAGQRGDILLWRDDRPGAGGLKQVLCQVSTAHAGPIFGLAAMAGGGGELLSCGKGGCVKKWQLQRSEVEGRETFDLVERGQVHMDMAVLADMCPCCGDMACLRGMLFDKKGGLLLSLGSGVLCEVAEGWQEEGADSMMSIVMEGHSRNGVKSLAWHPSLPLMVTACGDGSVKIWNREMRKAVCRASLSDPTAVAFSADGSFVVAGLGNGYIQALSTDALQPIDEKIPLKAGRKSISALRFSPNGRILAASSSDGSIHLFKYSGANSKGCAGLSKRSICKGSSGGVIAIDWSTDSSHLMSNTDSLDLTLWSVPATPQMDLGEDVEKIRPAAAPERHGEMDWATKTCLLGWHTQSLLHPVADLSLILSACRSNMGSIFSVGDSHGRVLLYRFPCNEVGKSHRTYRGHSEGVACLSFSGDDRHLASGGLDDHAVFIWQHRIVPPSDEDDPDVASFLLKRSSKHRQDALALDMGAGGETVDGEMKAVRPYFNSIFPPSKVSGEHARGEAEVEETFEIEYVHGYRGHDGCRNILYITPDEVLFSSAAVLVLLRINRNQQRIFHEHTDDVCCVALHPQGRLVASAQHGEGADALVWDTRHLAVAQRLSLTKGCTASALAFSRDGANLVVVGTGAEEMLFVFEWQTGRRLAMETAGRSRILAVGCHPDERTIVTCGVRNLTFWTMQKGHMSGREALGGGSKRQTMLCLGFSRDAQTLTGAQNGCIYIWKGNTHEKTVVAHRGPVMDLCVTPDGLVSAGKDGLARLWDFDLSASVRIDVGELTQGMLTEGEGPVSVRAVACLLEESEVEDGEPSRKIVLGMSTNRIVELTYSSRPHELDSMPQVRLIAQGHAGARLTCLATHPTKQHFATAGTDATVRLWDCESRQAIGSMTLPKPAGSLCFFPDGSELLIGMGDGSIVSVSSEEIEGARAVIVGAKLQDSKPAKVMCFSPGGEFLAAGLSTGCINIYDAAGQSEDGKWSLLCSLKNFSGAVTALDWTADSGFIQSNTSSFDLIFWDVRDMSRVKQLKRAAEVCDLTFPQWTCKMGWPISGAAMDVTEIGAVAKARTGTNNLVVGMADGTMTVARYPLLSNGAPKLNHQGHSPGVSGVAFTAGDKRIITIGERDKCAIQWKVSRPKATPGTSVADSKGVEEGSVLGGQQEFPRAKGEKKWHWGLVRLVLDADIGDWNEEREEALLARVAKVAKLHREQVRMIMLVAGSVVATLSLWGPGLPKCYRLLEEEFAAKGKLCKENRVVKMVCDCEVADIVTKLQGREAGAIGEDDLDSATLMQKEEGEAHDGMVKAYLSSMIPPEGFKASSAAPPAPEIDLQLESVLSCGGSDTAGNLATLRSGEIVFGAVSVAVVVDPADCKQFFYRGHAAPISALTVHPDGEIVATGDVGAFGYEGVSGSVHIWSSATLEMLAVPPRPKHHSLPLHQHHSSVADHGAHASSHPHHQGAQKLKDSAGGSITALSFSKDGTKLLVIDSAMGAALYDWRKKGQGSLISGSKADKEGNTVLAAAANPYDDASDETFVTCGVNHLKFWTARGGNLKGTGWHGDTKGRGNLQTMLCLGFTERAMTLVGTNDGSVYIFRNSSLLRSVENAHLGAVFCMDCSSIHVVTGGADGKVTRWKLDGKAGGGNADLSYLKSNLAADLAAGVHTGKGKVSEGPPTSVRSVKYRGSGGGGRASSGLLVGTSTNSLYEVDDVSNKSREIVGGHSSGRVTGIAEHPEDASVFITCGEDATVRLWNVGKTNPVCVRKLAAPAVCIDMSCDGSHIAVGMLRGRLEVFEPTKLEPREEQPPKRKKGNVRDVLYTPSGHYMAAGLDVGHIDLYDVLDGYSLHCTLKGHSSPVCRMDFCCAGKLMRSTTDGLELLHWDIDRKGVIRHIAQMRNTTWETSRCTLGWHASGLIASVGGIESNVACTESGRASSRLRSASESVMGDQVIPKVMAAGYAWGEVRLVRYPCAYKTAGYRSLTGHSGRVTSLSMSWDGERLMSTGGSDLAVFIWRIASTAFPRGVGDLITRTERLNAIASTQPPGLAHDDSLAGRLPTVCTNWNNFEAAQAEKKLEERENLLPPNELELAHVFGYRGHDSHANICVARCNDVLYVAGTMCVTIDTMSCAQQAYMGHSNDVSCMAMHPDGIHVATGEIGPNPCVCLWECESHRTVACIDASYLPGGAEDHVGFQNGITAMCFSPNGMWLVVVGADLLNTMFLIDWRNKEVVQAVKSGYQRVLACSWSDDDVLVTAGVDHAKFWAVKEGRLPSKGVKAVFGKLSRSTTMLRVLHVPVQHVQEPFSRSVTVTVGVNGVMFSFGSLTQATGWRPELLVDSVQAHQGAIFDLRMHILSDEQKRLNASGRNLTGNLTWVLSGGEDGLIKIWEIMPTINPKDKSATLISITPVKTLSISMRPTWSVLAHHAHEQDENDEEGQGENGGGRDDSTGEGTHRSRRISLKSSLVNESEAIETLISAPQTVIRSLCPSKEGVVFGTSDNRVILVPWEHNVGHEQRTLCEGHSGGKIRCAAMHPHLQVCATVGDDMTLRLWHVGVSKLMTSVLLPVGPRCLDFSPEGSALAIGMADGFVYIIQIAINDELASAELEMQQKIPGEDNTPVSCVRYSHILLGTPPKIFLAIGTEAKVAKPGSGGMDMGGDITLYDASVRYLLVENAPQSVADGHKGHIVSFDWSNFPEGWLQSTCSKGKTMHWGPVPSIKRESNIDLLCEMDWLSWTTMVGEPVKGLGEIEKSTANIISLDRSHAKEVVTAALRSGRILLARWPCMRDAEEYSKLIPSSVSGLRKPTVHSREPTSVRFTSGDRFVVSAGGADLCLAVWKHFAASQLRDAMLDSLILRVSSGVAPEQDEEQDLDMLKMSDDPRDKAKVRAATERHIEQVRKEKYIKTAPALPSPSEWKQAAPKYGQQQLQAPERVCELEHAYGYRGHDCARNVRFVQSLVDRQDRDMCKWGGEIVYHVGKLGIVYDTTEATEGHEAGGQKYFEGHNHEISCIDTSPDGYKVASGEDGGNSVLVWRIRDLAVLGSLRLPHTGGAAVVSFSASDPVGPLILVVGADVDHTVSVFNWTSHQPGLATFKGPGGPLAMRAGDKRAILAAACSGQDVWVTVGVKHIKFWSLGTSVIPAKGGQKEKKVHTLDFKRGIWGALVGVPTTLVSVVVIDELSLTLAGAEDGSIYIFKGTKVATVVPHPAGASGLELLPVFDIVRSHLSGLPGQPDESPVVLTGGKDGIARFWAVTQTKVEQGHAIPGIPVEKTGEEGDIEAKFGMTLIGELDIKNAAQTACTSNGLKTSHAAMRPNLVMALRSIAVVEKMDKTGTERFLLCGTSTNEVLLTKIRVHTGRLEAVYSPGGTRVLCQSHFSGKLNDVSAHPFQPIFATCGDDKTVRVFSSKDKTILAQGLLPAGANCLAWSPRESIDHHLAAGLQGGMVAVLIHRVGKHELQLTLLPVQTRDPYSITCLAFTTDNRYLAAGDSLGFVDIYDVSQAYNRVGMCRALEHGPMPLRSIQWSQDLKTLMTETTGYNLLYWDLKDTANLDCKRIENADAMSKEVWATWGSIVGWPVQGIHEGCAGGAKVCSVDTRADFGGIGKLKIIPGDKDGENMTAIGDSDGTVRLMKFPALCGGRDHRERSHGTVHGHGTEATKVKFSADSRKMFVACGPNLAVMQYKVLHPSEVGQSGKMLKAQQAASFVVSKTDREMFWKVSVAEIEEMRRRGMPADAVRVREPSIKKMRDQRLKVVDWTFDRLELRVTGMDWRPSRLDAQEADENVIPLMGGCTWKEMLHILENYFGRKDQQGKSQGVTIMYEKYEVPVPMRGREELCEQMLRQVLYKGRNQGDIEKIKAEARRTYSVKSELEYRQMWHYAEHQYRELVSAGVPFEGQAFRIDVHIIFYAGKKVNIDGLVSDTTGEQTDGESDVDEVLRAMPAVTPLAGDGDDAKERGVFPADQEPLAPTGWDQVMSDMPDTMLERESYTPWRLDITYADGYDGRASRGNLHFARGGDMIYPTGALCVVHHRNMNSQKIFAKHAPCRVSSLAVHPQGELVVSGESGAEPRIIVWNAHTMQIVCQMEGLQPKPMVKEGGDSLHVAKNKQAGGIACVSFGCGGDSYVVVVAGDEDNTVSVIDYKTKTIIATEAGGKNKIMAVACNSNDRIGMLNFVTVGVRHVRFWNLSRGRLTSKKGLFSGVPQASKTMLCAAFTDQTHDTARPEITFTGSKDGKVYIWKETKAVKVFQALDGPLFDMVVCGDQMAIGGKDKQAPLRVLSLPRGWPAQMDLTQRAGMHPDKTGHGRVGAGRSMCVRALAWKGAELLVGTAESNIYATDARTQHSKLAVRGHCGGAVAAIAAHPTKELLCSVGEDGLVRLWDTQQRVSAQYRHLRQALSAVAFHPKDGRHIAVGMKSGELTVLESVTLQEVKGLDKDVSFGRCEQHSTYRRMAVHAISYSPDARWLALAVGDGLIDLQEVDQGYRHVRSLQGHWGAVVKLDWGDIGSQQGDRWLLQSSGLHKELRHWSFTIKGSNRDVVGEMLDPASLRKEKIGDIHWNTWTLPVGWPVKGLANGLPLEAEDDMNVEAVGAVWHHGEVVLAGGGSKLRLFRWPCFSMNARFKEYSAHSAPVIAIAGKSEKDGVSAVFASGAAAGDGGCIVHWKLVKMESLGRRDLAEAAGGGQTSEACDDGKGKGKTKEIGARNLSSFAVLSHDFSRVCAITTDTEVSVFKPDWQLGAGQVLCKYSVHKESINCCSFSPQSCDFICTASSDRECHAWNVVESDDGDVVAESRKRQIFTGHLRDVIACSFSPDGKRVATASLDRTLIVWDVSGLASRQIIARGNGHRKAVLCIGWSDDGAKLASGSEDQSVRVWKVPEGLDGLKVEAELETEVRLKGHEEAIVLTSFSPRGQKRNLLASASLDQTVRVWDLETGDEIILIAHTAGLIGCAFSHCGFFVGTLALDNIVRLYDVSGGSSSLVDDTSKSRIKAGSILGAAFKRLENGQEMLVVAEVRPPSMLSVETQLYLPSPQSRTT